MGRINVSSCEIVLISIHTLPAFLNFIPGKYNYFNSTNDYAKYYLEQESKLRETALPQIEYDKGKSSFLCPMPRKHTLHSFWKAFRLPVRKAMAMNEPYDKFIFFLPLCVNFDMSQISDFDGVNLSLEAFIFPYGSIAFQLSAQFDDVFFENLTPIIQKLRKSSIFDNMRFDDYAHNIAMNLSRNMTGNDSVESFDSHNFVFIYETQPPLIYGEDESNDKRRIERRIISILNHTPLVQVTENTDTMRDELKYRFWGRSPRNDELLYFKPNTSFMYPSPTWITSVRIREDYSEALDKVDCMKHNYLSLITLTSSINRFIKGIMSMHRTPEMNPKILQFHECMNTFFKSKDLESCLINNKKNVKTISDAIGFKKNIDEFRKLGEKTKLN